MLRRERVSPSAFKSASLITSSRLPKSRRRAITSRILSLFVICSPTVRPVLFLIDTVLRDLPDQPFALEPTSNSSTCSRTGFSFGLSAHWPASAPQVALALVEQRCRHCE